MSEKLQQHHEKAAESLDLSAEAKHNLERIHKAAEHAEKAPKVEAARHAADKEAISGKDIAVEQKPASETSSFGLERDLKAKAYTKSLERIRDQLSPTERTFSRFTHNPAVDKTSNVVGKTVARPNGILGGAICALLGSLYLVYASNHYGFRYNYTMFIVLFVGGYLLGSALELILWALVGRRRHQL